MDLGVQFANWVYTANTSALKCSSTFELHIPFFDNAVSWSWEQTAFCCFDTINVILMGIYDAVLLFIVAPIIAPNRFVLADCD